jgi:uncharacterized protein (TIGR02453 family)
MLFLQLKSSNMNMKNVLAFLSELKENNTREWFADHKAWYDEAKAEYEAFTAQMINRIAAFDPEIGYLAPRDCTFRIYRDVRFSKDKEPYKANMGAAMTKGGKKSKYAAYYLHIEPGNSFIGGGKWMPPSDELKLIRMEIFHFPDALKKIINETQFVTHFGGISGDKLKKPPKDFPSDFEDIELLKFKSYIVGENLTDDEVTGEELPEKVISAFKIMKPFIHFLNKAMDEA